MRTDEFIDRLGTYFVHFDIGNRYKLTFHAFVVLVERGEWEVWVS